LGASRSGSSRRQCLMHRRQRSGQAGCEGARQAVKGARQAARKRWRVFGVGCWRRAIGTCWLRAICRKMQLGMCEYLRSSASCICVRRPGRKVLKDTP
jgi:hypothetical protein